MKKRGRKPVPENHRRSERLSVALSRAEVDRVCLAAMRLRMPPSEFIRLMVLMVAPDSNSQSKQFRSESMSNLVM